MLKITSTLRGLNYEYHADRKGAKYTLDGVHFMNGGDFSELSDKFARGIDDISKDANTPFDKGSDIEELEISVKSSKATLTSTALGESYDEIKTNYFQRVHSKSWDWVVIIEDEITIYNMNKAEFAEFMDTWATYCKDRKVIRFKATSTKMIKWLEERVA